MDTRKVAHQYRPSQWAPIISECKSSGMTVMAWCLENNINENNINEKQFYYWQRRVREELSSTVVENSDSLQVLAFVPLSKPADFQMNDNTLFHPDIVLHSGNVRIEISNHTSPQLLAEILKGFSHV